MSAQSSVTLYGRIDAGYSNVENQSSVGGLNSTKSGIGSDGLNTSLWGIKGSEDLGGGMKASFQLESSLNSTDGSGMTGFNRVSTLGLSGNFGEFKVGRDYTPIYSVITATDIFSRTGATTVNLIPTGTRTSNMVSYSTPTFAGFTVKGMVGDNKSSDTATGSSTLNPAAAAETSNKTTGLSAVYDNGPFMVSLAWGESKGASSDPTIANNFSYTTTASGQQDGTAIAASYDFGVVKLFANYIESEIRPDAGNNRIEAKETNLGVTVPIGAFTLLAAYGHNDTKSNYNSNSYAAPTINGNGNDYVLGATYDLSKRTALYLKTGSYNKVTGTILGYNNADYKSTATALGIRHTF